MRLAVHVARMDRDVNKDQQETSREHVKYSRVDGRIILKWL